MIEQRILYIRESIAEAHRIEAKNHRLRDFLEAKLPELHHAISLPHGNGVDVLQEFITHYIEHVPDFLEALAEITST